MFGYIKPSVSELKVREHELYRAVYCGLCRSMGRHTGCASRFSLSYDFVFLALVRMALENTPYHAKRRRCMAHPVKKRSYICDNAALSYCAKAAVILADEKLRDDIKDERGMKRLTAKMLLPAAKSARKRAGKKASCEWDEPSSAVKDGFERLFQLEKERSPSVDAAADAFGTALSGIFSCGLTTERARIAAEIGRCTGKFIYVLDAADDAARDEKTGSYNPVLLTWGDCLCEREYVNNGRTKVQRMLKTEIAENLRCAMLLQLGELEKAAALIDYSECRELRGLIENIIYMGMPQAVTSALGLDNKD